MFLEAFCEYPFNRCRVTCEGHVAMCCFMRPDRIRDAKQAYLGNLFERSFDEIWFGAEAEAIRAETRAGRIHTKCQTEGCPFMAMKPPLPKFKVVYNEYPTFLEIDLPNTHCNVGGLKPNPLTSPACVMCERAAPDFRPEENKLFEVLDRVKHIFHNLQNVHIQGIAEPFYESRKSGNLLFDVLDAIGFDAYANRITLSITTNGTLLKGSVRQQYLQRVPHSVTTFSLDAATPETYKKIRILDCFEKVLENLAAFSKEREPRRQYLLIHNNINTLNLSEVLGMVHIADMADVDCVEFNPTNGFCQEILVNPTNCGLFKKAQDDIIGECNRLQVNYRFMRPLDMSFTDKLVQLTL
jgi:molybdenum cofactor biosynthesis enzyme MoaA